MNNTTNSMNQHSATERATMLGDELTKAIEAYAKQPTADRLSDFSAALVGRCASMAAAAVVSLYERVSDLEAGRDDRP